MPVHSFRFEINNASTNFLLAQSFNHLCGGAWTNDQGPPDAISPGQQIAFQAESDGILTGTEGYIKYDVIRRPSNKKEGMVYMYFDNPYYGVTCYRPDFDGNDVFPDCDFDKPQNSAFPSPVETYKFGTSRPEAQGVDASDWSADFVAAGVVTPVLFFFATAGIKEHAVAHLALVEPDFVGPSFVPGPEPGKRSLKPMTSASLNDWAGEWSGPHVAIQIRQESSVSLSCTIIEGQGAAQFVATQSFLPGPRGALSFRFPSVIGTVLNRSGVSPSEGAMLHSSTMSLVQSLVHGGAQTEIIRETFAKQLPGRLPSNARNDIVGAVNRVVKFGGAIAYLNQGIVLHLYEVFEDSVKRGTSLQYQRFNDAGDPVFQSFLVSGGLVK